MEARALARRLLQTYTTDTRQAGGVVMRSTGTSLENARDHADRSQQPRTGMARQHSSMLGGYWYMFPA